MAWRKCTGNFTINEYNVLHRALSELSRITLVNVMTYLICFRDIIQSCFYVKLFV